MSIQHTPDLQPDDGLLLVRPTVNPPEQHWVEVQALSGGSLTLRLAGPVEWRPGEPALLLRKLPAGRLIASASVFGGNERAVNASLKGPWRNFNSRDTERFPTALPAWIQRSEGGALDALVVDFSVGGMQLTCAEPLAETERLSVKIKFGEFASMLDCELRNVRRLDAGQFAVNLKFGRLITPQALFVRSVVDDHREALELVS